MFIVLAFPASRLLNIRPLCSRVPQAVTLVSTHARRHAAMRLFGRFRKTDWQRKQDAAAPGRFYGDGGTIHSTGYVDVEVHDGQVVAVWFRCQFLPFKQANTGTDRAREMRSMYEGPVPALTGVQVDDRV